MGKKGIDWDDIKWGSLTRWLRRHESKIKEVTGMNPFTKTGEINDRVLRKLKNPDVLKKVTKKWKYVRKKILFKLNVLKG